MRTTAHIITLAITLCFSCVFASSSSDAVALHSKTLSLNEAILLALRHNPDVKNAEIQRISDKFALRVAKNNFELQYSLTGNAENDDSKVSNLYSTTNTAQLTPGINKNGVYGTQYGLQMNNTVTNGIYNPGISLAITQPLMRGFGKNIATASLYTAEENEKINKLNLRSQLIQNVVSVITAYRQLVADQNNVFIDRLSMNDYKQTVKIDKALIKAGRLAPTEVVQAQADYAQAQLTLRNDQNTVITDRLTLLNVTGLPLDTKFKIPTDITTSHNAMLSNKQLYKIALGNSVAYLSQIEQVKIEQRQLLVDKDASRTQLDLAVNISKNNQTQTVVTNSKNNNQIETYINNDNKNRSIQLNFDIPINDDALKQAVVDDQVNLQKNRLTLNNQARQLQLLIAQDIQTVKSAYANIDLAKETLNLQHKNQKMLQVKLKYGLVNTFEVTTKQKDLDQARIQYIQQKINYLDAITQLYSDMGTILDKWNIKVRY